MSPLKTTVLEGRASDILQQHGNYGWLTASGSFAIVNNGIEFAATCLVMLVALYFTGAGRWLSVDYWFQSSRSAMADVQQELAVDLTAAIPGSHPGARLLAARRHTLVTPPCITRSPRVHTLPWSMTCATFARSIVRGDA